MRLQTQHLKDGRTKVTAYDGRKVVGAISIYPRYTHGQQVMQVLQSNVKRDHKRQGIGTQLYQAAAQSACDEGMPLASSPKWMRSPDSSGFWEKQARKGRARDIGDGVFVLTQSCGADLSGVPGCAVHEDDTGGIRTMRFHVSCSGDPRAEEGHIKIHRAYKKVRGKTVWTVDSIRVNAKGRRKGLGTALYEAAAEAVCKRRNALVSFGPRTEKSEGFWQKQLRKGRVVEFRQRDVTQPGFLLDCSEASDLSGLDLTRNQMIGLGVGVGALVLLAVTGKKSNYASWLVPTVSRISAPPAAIQQVLANASKRYDVPMPILVGIAHTESRYDPKAGSSAGAQGLMQLMPQTAASLGVQNVWDAQDNAYGGAKLLSALRKQYGSWEKAFAAYNWGQGNVNSNPEPWQWPQATRNYVANVLRVAEIVG